VRPFPIEELVDRCGSRFTVVVAAAKRAKQIKEGAPPLLNLPTRNPLTIALHEIAAGLVLIGPEPIIVEPVAVATLAEPIGELAAPEVVEALIAKSSAPDPDADIMSADDDYDSELDEEIAEDLDEDLEEEDEDEEEEEETETDEDEEEEEWEAEE
jgi:DNA-directed RNA polymerase subunit omega